MIINVADYRQTPHLVHQLLEALMGTTMTGVFEIIPPRAGELDMLKKKPEPDLRHLATIFRDIFTKPGIAGNEGRILMAIAQLQELLGKPELTAPPRDDDPHICATCSATCKITHTSEKCLG
jgi:hypothetical protein